MAFPAITETERVRLLAPPTGKTEAVLDTDTFNEIDDQYALTHALLSPSQIDLLAVYAAPFLNDRSDSPGDGMHKSFAEIKHILKLCQRPHEAFAFQGSTEFLSVRGQPVVSPAAEDLINKALQPRDKPL